MVNSHGRFVWYELMTTDMEAAKAFYASVVGWSARDAAMPGVAYSVFTAGDAPVAGLLKLPDQARKMGVAPHWIGYVGVGDVDAAATRAGQLGGAVHIPPADVPNISRFSVIADPQKAVLALIKELKPRQEQPFGPRTLGHVGWHELLAADWEKAFAFYAELFGWQKAESHVGAMGRYQQFSAGGEPIGGMFTKPPELPFPFWLYYFNVSSIEAVAQRAQAGGGQIVYGPAEVPGGSWIVHCTDPQGAIFGLLDRRMRKAVGYFLRDALPEPAVTRAASRS
jgi:predicted enzyme related to lactoylglutathione lyase